jgi:hypothetical protein
VGGTMARNQYSKPIVEIERTLSEGPCIVTNFFLIKPKDALISQISLVKKLNMFRAEELPETYRIT